MSPFLRTMPIPTFAADGRRLRPHTARALEHLYSLSRVVVRRNAKGRILVARYRDAEGGHPLRLSALGGTRYSSKNNTTKVWEHKQLPTGDEAAAAMGEKVEDPKEVDLFVRAVFRAVPLSVMKQGA